MQGRREFLKSLATIGVAGSAITSVAQTFPTAGIKTDDRSYWLAVLQKIATPVLANLARRELKKTMPVQARVPADRVKYAHLEAIGRLLAGIAPWLATRLAIPLATPGLTIQRLDRFESTLQQNFLRQAQLSLDAATDPNSPDFMNFHNGDQPLVDTAFLAQGILRAPSVLWEALDARVQGQVIEAMKSSRAIATPARNNWVMFAAMIEAALQTMGEKTIEERLENCVRRMLSWYKGDGVYGDGEFFHFDYYNSFVIHPMLLDVLAVLKRKDSQFEALYATELQRARRYAEIQ